MEQNNIYSEGARKVLYYKERIQNYRAGKNIDPVVIEIHPTERCNHACPNCQAQYNIPSKSEKNFLRKWGEDMNFEMLDSLWEHKPEGIVISGNTGDPLVHPKIGDLIEKINSLDIPFLFFTNGQNLTLDLARLIFPKCRGMRISVDAHNAELYQKTHGASAEKWDALQDTIRSAADLKKSLNSSCDFGIGYLTREDTRYGMIEAARLARELGVDYIQFRPFHYTYDDVSKEISTAENLQTDSFKVYASNQKYSLLQSRERSYAVCHGSYMYSVIDPRGDVYMCCHTVKNKQAVMGSLKKNTWPEILAGAERGKVINSFAVHACVPLCRLNTINTAIERALQTGEIPDHRLSEKLLKHVMFL